MISTTSSFTENLMTVEEFLALPDNDSFDRILIRGRKWEKPKLPHDWRHASCNSSLSHLLTEWSQSLNKRMGRGFAGECGFLLRENPASVVGIDVAFVSCEVLSRTNRWSQLVNGIPLLAIEILSPDDLQEEINTRVGEYLEVGVPLVWVVEPISQTVMVHCQDEKTRLFAGDEVLVGEPFLPGLRVVASRIFAD